MPGMNIKFKIAIALLPVILMASCGRKSSPAKLHNTESKATEPLVGQSDVSAPAPAKMNSGQTTVPITGALGWTLGAKKPISMSDNSIGMSDYIPVTNTPPFTQVQLSWLKDGTIYEIITWVNLNRFADVERALNDKYGPPADLRTQSEFKAWAVSVSALEDYNGRVLIWTNAGCTVELILNGGGGDESSLTYCNKALEQKWFDAAADENQRRARSLAPKL
jgi:hypothetical protein